MGANRKKKCGRIPNMKKHLKSYSLSKKNDKGFRPSPTGMQLGGGFPPGIYFNNQFFVEFLLALL
jgi:hypothetical protein